MFTLYGAIRAKSTHKNDYEFVENVSFFVRNDAENKFINGNDRKDRIVEQKREEKQPHCLCNTPSVAHKPFHLPLPPKPSTHTQIIYAEFEISHSN